MSALFYPYASLPGVPQTADAFPDTVDIYPPEYADDDRGSPTQADGSPLTLKCQVFASTTGTPSAPMPHRLDREDRPAGVTHYIILFGVNPGVTNADQKVVWRTAGGTTLDPPLTLYTVARSRPPGSGDVLWRVDAENIV